MIILSRVLKGGYEVRACVEHVVVVGIVKRGRIVRGVVRCYHGVMGCSAVV